MKFLSALVLCSVITFSMVLINASENINDYEPLITKLYEKYRTAGVLIAAAGNNNCKY